MSKYPHTTYKYPSRMLQYHVIHVDKVNFSTSTSVVHVYFQNNNGSTSDVIIMYCHVDNIDRVK